MFPQYTGCEFDDNSFGFLPLGMVEWPLGYYQILKNDTVPNFLGRRLRLPSNLNINAWETLLKDF